MSDIYSTQYFLFSKLNEDYITNDLSVYITKLTPIHSGGGLSSSLESPSASNASNASDASDASDASVPSSST